MTDHPDFEALSAHHDGEAPEWAGHVTGCEACRSRLQAMAEVGAVVRRTPPPASAATRETAISTALAAVGGGAPGAAPDEPAARSGKRRTARWAAAASVAAVLLALAGTLAVLRDGSDGTTTTADRALTDSPAPSAATEAAGQLGEVGDAEALVAKVGPGLRASRALDAARGTDAANENRTAAGPPEQGPSPAAGTRPCELEARAVDPGLGEVVYAATGTRDGTPLIVLGFTRRSGGDEAGAQITLLALARNGCQLLFSTPL